MKSGNIRDAGRIVNLLLVIRIMLMPLLVSGMRGSGKDHEHQREGSDAHPHCHSRLFVE